MNRIIAIALVISTLSVPDRLSAQAAPELHADAAALQDKSEKKLKAAYEALIQRIKAENSKERAELLIKHLQDSQKAWNAYRDAQVAFVGIYGDVGSASARAAGLATYSAELTEQRIKDLGDVPDPF